MRDFEFQTVPHIMMSYGAARRLGELLRARYAGLARVCVVTDRFLNTCGLIRPALDGLAAQGWQVTLIDDVIADPPDHVVLDAAQRARQARIEVVVGLGGGSSMDVAKLIAVLAASDQPLGEILGHLVL